MHAGEKIKHQVTWSTMEVLGATGLTGQKLHVHKEILKSPATLRIKKRDTDTEEMRTPALRFLSFWSTQKSPTHAQGELKTTRSLECFGITIEILTANHMFSFQLRGMCFLELKRTCYLKLAHGLPPKMGVLSTFGGINKKKNP